MTKATAKEIALVTAVIINEKMFDGSTWDNFDRIYSIAEKFVKIYPADFNWEYSQIDFESMVVMFTRNLM